jgi:glutaredoxin 3
MTARVRMYTTGVCGYCRRAEALLAARGVDQIEKLRVDLDPKLLAEMMQKTGRRTVPQIFIDEKHVGGYDDLAAIDRAGELTAMLGESPPNPRGNT